MNDSLFSDADLDPELMEIERKKKERERIAKEEQRLEEKKKEEEKKASITYDKTLYVLDGYSIIYRNYFAHIKKPIFDKKGNNISAYYGFFQTLLSLMNSYPMDALAITMDEKGPTFRHELYPEYKANREKAPQDLHAQVQPIKDTLSKMKIPVLSRLGFEADDLMASLSSFANENGWNVVIVTGDKDLCQLVGEHVIALRPPKNGEKKYVFMDKEGVKEFYGVYPEQIVDYRTILGDSSDNVPGVKGIGEKGAVKLLTEYLTLDGVYRHLDSLSKGMRKSLGESKDNIELSRTLIELRFDASPEGFGLEAMRTSSFDIPAAAEDFFIRDMKKIAEMASAKKNGGEGRFSYKEKYSEEETAAIEPLLTDGEKYLLEKGSYEIVKDKAELEKRLEKAVLFNSLDVALEFLSDGFEPDSPLLGVSLSLEPLKAFFVPFGEDGIALSDFSEISNKYFSGKMRVISHSAKSQLSRSKRFSIPLEVKSDTMIEAWMVNSNEGVFSLDFTVSRYFSQTLLSISDLCGESSVSSLSLEEKARYTNSRADYIHRLSRVLERRLHEKGLWNAYISMEIPLIPILSEMEENGILLSEERMNELKTKTDQRLNDLVSSIYKEAGYEFNINSTLQLSNLLFEERKLPPGKKTQRGYSTDTATLEGLRNTGDPIIEELLEYRALSKLKSTYIDVLPTLTDREGRIHTSFLQTGTATGRLSSRNPNLQNIPVRTDEGRLIRNAFVPGEGNIFISADYSQIELVVLSWMAKDPGLMDAFLSGGDVHKYTAALIYEKNVDEVTPKERRVAKTINFGIMYGMSAFRLSNELGITRTEAQEFINKYFQRYSGVKQFVEDTVKSAEEKGYITTYWGHMREIVGINSRNKTEKAAAERTAVNSVIQGTAAEIMKKAMISVASLLKERGFKTKLLLQVHDELIFQVPAEEADEVEKLIKEKMENVVSLPVPLRSSVERGYSWGDMH